MKQVHKNFYKKLKVLALGLLITIGAYSQFGPGFHSGGVRIGTDLVLDSVYVTVGGDTILRVDGVDFKLSDIRLKLSISDTAAMLLTYINKADTASMLTPYALTSEAGAIFNSGSGITVDGSNNIDLEGALDAPAIITGTEVNYLNIEMSDASDRSARFIFRPADGLGAWAYSGDAYNQDSSYLRVDSNLVSMGVYDGGLVKSITADTNKFEVRDDDNGVGLVTYADYTSGLTSLAYTPKVYQDTRLGGQVLNSTVYSPTPAEHGDVVVWDSLSEQYVSLNVVPASQSAGIVVSVIDTILYDNTTVDTIVTLPVGAVIMDIQVCVITTFNGSGTNLLDVGIIGDTDRYENDLDLAVTPVKFLGLANLWDRMTAFTHIIFQYADSGANASTGFAIIYVVYFRT